MFVIGQENPTLFWLVMLAGGAFALGLGWYRCARAGIGPRRTLPATLLLPLLATFFSHLLYCAVTIDDTLYTHPLGYLFAFWEPGHMLYGGMLGAALALCLAGGKDRLRMLDGYAPSAALMIAAARVCEGLIGQGYGEYWYEDATALCRFPWMVYDPYYEAWAWALFMLEAVVALLLFAALLRKRRTWPGDGALLLLGLYASAQIVLESLRRDEYLRWGFVRVEEAVSAALVLAVLACYALKKPGGRRAAKAACFGVCASMIVLCLLLEFATEGRIPFLTFLDVNGCYAVMAGACAVMGGCVLWMRRLCDASHAIKNGKERCL